MSSQTQNQSAPSAQRPSEESIRAYAYELYLRRGCAPGHEVDDWLQAELELSAALSNSEPRQQELMIAKPKSRKPTLRPRKAAA